MHGGAVYTSAYDDIGLLVSTVAYRMGRKAQVHASRSSLIQVYMQVESIRWQAAIILNQPFLSMF